MLTFDGLKINELCFVNRIEKQGRVEMKLQQSMRTRVAFREDERSCVCTIYLTIQNEEAPNDFFLRAELAGVYGYPTETDQKTIHIEAVENLFPFVSDAIANLCKAAGLPEIRPHMEPIKSDEISNS